MNYIKRYLENDQIYERFCLTFCFFLFVQKNLKISTVKATINKINKKSYTVVVNKEVCMELNNKKSALPFAADLLYLF